MNIILVFVAAYCLGGKVGLGISCLCLLGIDFYDKVIKG